MDNEFYVGEVVQFTSDVDAIEKYSGIPRKSAEFAKNKTCTITRIDGGSVKVSISGAKDNWWYNVRVILHIHQIDTTKINLQDMIKF